MTIFKRISITAFIVSQVFFWGHIISAAYQLHNAKLAAWFLWQQVFSQPAPKPQVLNGFISVLDLGAKCDGSTDDTVAIQAALTQANANKGTTVVFPIGVCVVASSLNISNFTNVNLKGSTYPGLGVLRASVVQFTQSGTGTDLVMQNFRDGSIEYLELFDSNTLHTGMLADASTSESDLVSIDHVIFQGPSNGATSICLNLDDVDNFTVFRSAFFGCKIPIMGVNGTFSTTVNILYSLFDSLPTQNATVCMIRNPGLMWNIVGNVCEVGATNRPLIDCSGFTGGSVNFSGNWASDQTGTPGAYSWITTCPSSKWEAGGNLLTPAVNTTTLWTLGNNSTLNQHGNNYCEAGTAISVFIALGTGNTVENSGNCYSGITTFSTGTLAHGQIVDNNSARNVFDPILALNGTQAAGSYSFQGHPGDSFYSNGAGTLEAAIGGTQSFQWSTGNFDCLANACQIRFGGSVDTGISRSAAATLAIGNGITGNATGTLQVQTINGGNSFNIVGTGTNNSANAGSVGELISATRATGSSVALSTGTPANVTNVSLTAGDWDCSGAVDFTFGATTSVTNLAGSISQTTATMGPQDSGFDSAVAAMVPTAANDSTFPVPVFRESLSGTTTIFLVANATFSVSTAKAYGTLRCRRVR